jgi:hypothetical protein
MTHTTRTRRQGLSNLCRQRLSSKAVSACLRPSQGASLSGCGLACTSVCAQACVVVCVRVPLRARARAPLAVPVRVSERASPCACAGGPDVRPGSFNLKASPAMTLSRCADGPGGPAAGLARGTWWVRLTRIRRPAAIKIMGHHSMITGTMPRSLARRPRRLESPITVCHLCRASPAA